MIHGLDDTVYGGHMTTGNECGSNFLTFALRLRENYRKNLNQETDLTGDWVSGDEVTPDHSACHIKRKH